MELNIIDYIPIGVENGVTTAQLCRTLGITRRRLRFLINEAREENVICNMQDGSGFFRPDFNRKEDALAFRSYLRSEEARAYSIKRSLRYAKEEAGKWGIHD